MTLGTGRSSWERGGVGNQRTGVLLILLLLLPSPKRPTWGRKPTDAGGEQTDDGDRGLQKKCVRINILPDDTARPSLSTTPLTDHAISVGIGEQDGLENNFFTRT